MSTILHPKDEKGRALRVSAEAHSAIEELESTPVFTNWYQQRLREIADSYAESVLHSEELSDRQREDLRQRRLGILEALSLPGVEKSTHEKILKDAGMSPGQVLPELS